jgi:5-carboxyvanillate decarboxylase
MPAAVPYQRIATEEAWATRELIDLYLKMVETGSSNDPGFDSLWGHYGGGRSERVTQVLERLLDVGERRLCDMDTAGIDKQLLLLTSPGVQLFDSATAIAVAAASNDEAAETVRRHPDRLAALAAIAPQDPQAAAKSSTIRNSGRSSKPPRRFPSRSISIPPHPRGT